MNIFFLLKQCDIAIDHLRNNVLQQIEDIFEDTDYCEQIQFSDHEDMLKRISEHINDNKKELIISGINLSETKDSLYVLYYIDPPLLDCDHENLIGTNNKSDRKDINLFASQLAEETVYGNAVICRMKIVYKFNDQNISSTIEPDTVNMQDFVEKIGEKFIKNGIVSNVDGSIDRYKYASNPLEPLMASVADYDKFYRYHEYEFFNMVLQVIVDIREDRCESNINQGSSFICNQIVHGRTWIGMYRKPYFNENPPYISIDHQLLEKIIKIKNYSSTIGTGVSVSPEQYINFYTLVDLECERLPKNSQRNIKTINQSSLNDII